ncbi:hypothetical protein BH11MYX4_BH11MYX4_55490 [soil metagenome]
MKRVHRLLLVAAAVLVLGALLAAGCWLDVGLWHPAGHATLRWTVDGQVDRTACTRRGADRVEVRAVDAWGDTHTRATPRCDAFAETLALPSGWYHAELTMVDGAGRAVSDTLSTETFRVVLGHESIVVVTAVDFRECTTCAEPMGAAAGRTR